jgi:hypothetical protein
VLGVLSLFLAGLSGGVIVHVISSFVDCRASRNWPSVQGKVERADVSRKVERSARGRPMIEYSAVVVYEYEVEGRKYSSYRLAFGSAENYAASARAEAGRYRPDQKVDVYYDPANPNYAVLERRVTFGTYLWGLLGVPLGFATVRLLCTSLIPTRALANSRWLPWAHRLTWPDLILAVVGLIGMVFWMPMMLGL